MKNCRQIHPDLALFREGALPPGKRSRVEKHLEACPEARRELEQLDRLGRALKGLPEPSSPPDLHERIMARLPGGARSRPSLFRFRIPTGLGLAAAALLAFFLLVRYPDRFQSAGPSPSVSLEKGRTLQPPAAAPGPMKKTARIKSPPSPKEVDQPRPAVSRADSTGALKYFPSKSARLRAPANAPLSPRREVLGGGAALPSAAPQAQVIPESIPVPHSPASTRGLEGTGRSGFQILITDEASLRGAWNRLDPGRPQPRVDFENQAVLLLSAGTEPTAGYSIRITRLEEAEARLTVHYRIQAPAPDAVTAQVLTHPWTFRIIPKPSRAVVFQRDP